MMRLKLPFAGRRKKIARAVFFGLCGLFVAGLVAAPVVFLTLSKDLPSVEELDARAVSESTKIYDRTGTILLYESGANVKRTVLPFDKIPQSLKDATISIEDENFYKGQAFDIKGILRALYVDIVNREIRQGASTITQQLARNAFLAREKTITEKFTRKIKELLLAIQLNKRYTKDQILGFYLNEIPYGGTAYGAEAASGLYFGKSATELTLPESAFLAALANAPSYYSPWGTHTKELMERQRLVLRKMRELGKISEEEFAAALKQKVVVVSRTPQSIKAPHFVMAVQDYLEQTYGASMAQSGGLKVKTTLDWNLQQLAEKSVSDGAAQNEKLYKGKNAALIAEDPTNGQILALVGSRDYFDTKNEGNFNVAIQGLRQPGSALKPFAYLTAFQKGYTPDTVLFDVPTEFSAYPSCPAVPVYNDKNTDKKCFHPQNYEGTFIGPVSMRDALARSINIPAVKTLYLAGLRDVVTNVNRFGLSTLEDPNIYGLSLVLGGGAVHLIDLVKSYGVLASDGVRHEQSMVLEVRDAKGNLVESFADKATRVIDAQYTRLVNDILTDTQARAGLFHSSLGLTIFPDHDVALKTGTSNDYRDAWAMGFTPTLVVGVWAGNNDNSPMVRQGSSILAAIPMWHAFMAEALKTQPLVTFPKPDPLAPEKPILRGDYLANRSVHTILYYVDKNNPAGPSPVNPGADSQFNNWETGVIRWAKNNLPNFDTYNQTSTASSTLSDNINTIFAPPVITITNPVTGSFVNGSVPISAIISASAPIVTVNVLLNGAPIQTFTGNSSNQYTLNWVLDQSLLVPQNLIEVSAVDQSGMQAKIGIIIYKQP